MRILETRDFEVREIPAPATPVIFQDFTPDEIERMAELEHGRWNLERLREGWRFGPRDDARRRHPCLVSWSELPDAIKKFDRDAVRHFPEILARAGLEVVRKSSGPQRTLA